MSTDKEKKMKVLKVGMVSMVLTLLIMGYMHFYWNDSPTYGHGVKLVKWLVDSKERKIDHEPLEDVVLINVSYDKTVVPYFTSDYDSLGVVDVTDRKKLNSFLNMLKKRNAYRYIVCDINFSDPLLASEYDEELFATIASMKNIVVASSDMDMDPEVIKDKVALSIYKEESVGSGFLRYDFMKDGKPSIALKMWMDLFDGTYEEFWWGARMNGKPCLQTVMPDFRYVVYDEVHPKDSSLVIQQMGKTLEYYNVDSTYVRGFDDKVVLIGAWTRDDVHNTILGRQPGVLIVYNAFLSLCNRDNHVPVWAFLLVLIVVWLEIMFIFRKSYDLTFCSVGTKVMRFIEKKREVRRPKVLKIIGEILLSFIEYVTPLAILMVLVYWTCGIFLNILIIAVFLGGIDFLYEKLNFAK